jgi:hypothetical protein
MNIPFFQETAIFSGPQSINSLSWTMPNRRKTANTAALPVEEDL